MNSKITNTNRYKKVTKADIKKRNKIIKNNIKNNNINIDINKNITTAKVKNKPKFKFNLNEDYKNVIILMAKIFSCVFGVFLISLISILCIDKNEKIITVFKNNNEKVNVNINYDLKIGIKDLDLNKNICINELNKYTKEKLLVINDKYEIEYRLIKEIEKVTDTAYKIVLKNNKNIDNIIKKINDLDIVSKVEKIDDVNLSVMLKENNPYFIYYLDNINIDSDESSYKVSNLNYFRNDDKNNKTLKSISILRYDDSENLISDFLNKKNDMFLTSSEDELRAISSHNYNIKKYRNGENYFLLFNKNNEMLKNTDIREAISLAINKKSIAKILGNNFYDVIDIPYLYSKIDSKYDKIGSENIIIKNSYIKKNGIYYNKNKSLTFKLIVNKNDTIKCKIADEIKNMLSDVGIRVDIIKCNNEEIKNNVINSNYDLLLATVNLNEIPDITFLYNYININNLLKEEIDNINKDLITGVKNMQKKIREEVLCIGIVSSMTSVITQKDIYGFDDISYNNIFKNINNVGSIVNEK